MHATRSISRTLPGLLLILGGAAPTLGAQLTSNQAQVTLSAQPFTEALTVSVSPAVVNFTLSKFGPSLGDAELVVTTDYVLESSGIIDRQLAVYLYFTDPDAALINGASAIPSSRVFAQYFPLINRTPFSGPSGFNIQTTLNPDIVDPDVMAFPLRIDATGMSLVPGTYQGTLFVQAQVL